MINSCSRHAASWLFLLVSLLTVIVYYPGLAGDYMFDDTSNLLENRQLNIDSLDMESLESAAFSSEAGTLRRPVSMASFALNRYFFGIGPYSNKVVNLAIHLLTGLALFLLSRQILRSYRENREPGLSDGLVTWMPLVVSGLWLVHPLNLSAVLYIVQRMTSLSALFTACGLYMYVAGRRRMLAGKSGLTWIIAGLLVFGGLAVLSKENGVLLPLYMLVLETALFRFHGRSGQADVGIVIFYILVVAIPAVLALLYLASHSASYLNFSGRDFTLSERLLTEARVLVFYLKMIVMPSIRELGLYHDDIAISHGLLDPPATLFSIMALGGMLAIAFLLLGKRPLVSLGIFWFFAGHSLESSIFPLEIAHEHRNYLADYGILLALASGIAEAPLRRLAPVINYAAPAVLFLLFAYTTRLRSEQWSDNINQAVYEARHHPDSFRSVYVAGRIHARLALNGHTGSEAKAFDFLEKASRLDKSGIMPDVTMIKLDYLLHKPVDQQLFDTVLYKLSHFPLSPSDVSSLKSLAECAGKSCDIPETTLEAIFKQALHSRNADVLTIYGYYRINKKQDFSGGLDLFERAVQRDPGEPQRWKNLINLLIVMQRFDDAQRRLDQFRTADIYGSNERDYRVLQEDINRVRQQYLSQARLEAGGNN
jgi:hypothetical protein